MLQNHEKRNSEQEQPVIQFNRQIKTERQVSLFAMNKITQTMLYRQSLIKYAEKFGVTAAAIHYKENRQYIYRWRKRYDGTLKSLADRSHRPHSHPNQHTQEEIKLILNMRRRNPHTGLVRFWVKLRQKGYKRSISGLYRFLRKRKVMAVKVKNPKKYTPKPYEQMQYPGQRVQIDVKYVPKSCIVGQEKGTQWYQYTFIDEYTRFRYLEAFPDHNTYTSAQFIQHCVKRFPYRIECVQTDNGTEFTNAMSRSKNPKPSLFETTLQKLGIQHKRIRIFTPRHNGKVERSHRKDNEEFYAIRKFYSFEDFKKQLAGREREYNHFPMRPLDWHSPIHTLRSFSFLNPTV